MNIIKIQDELKGVPDNALIGYVKNPTGNVPSYLALSELQRRKEMRAKYQQAQPEKSTVAEDLTQPAQPQGGLAALAKNATPQGAPTSQGVADLPVDENMYQEQNFANGGIVSFAGPTGSYVVPSKTPQQYYQGIAGNKDIGKSFMFNKFETPYDEAINYYSGLKQNANNPEAKRQLEDAVQELQLQKYRFTRSKEDPTERMTQTGLKGDASGKPIPPSLTLASMKNKIEGNNPLSQNPVDQVKRGATGQNQVDETPVADTVTDNVNVTEKDYFKKRPEDVAETERDRYKQMYGDDPFVKRSQTRLESMDKRAKSMDDSNLGLALMSAGFKTMQGTSPYALANIGAGAEAGVKSYGDTQKQLAELDEKRFNVDSKIADAERAVKLAAMQHGFKSEEYNKASNDLAKIENIKGEYDIEKYKVLAGTKETQTVMKQKSDFLTKRDTYLKNNYSIKNALDTYMNKSKFDRLPENEKRSVLGDVETYNQYIQELKISYPLANMDLPTRDPIALLNKVR
jgi:hypothetical protein